MTARKRAPDGYRRYAGGRAEAWLPSSELAPEALLWRGWHTPGRLLHLLEDRALLEVLGPECVDEWLRVGRSARAACRLWIHAVFSLYVRRNLRVIRHIAPGSRVARMRTMIDIGPPGAEPSGTGPRWWVQADVAAFLLRSRAALPGRRVEPRAPYCRVPVHRRAVDTMTWVVPRDMPVLDLAHAACPLPWSVDVEVIDQRPIIAYEVEAAGGFIVRDLK